LGVIVCSNYQAAMAVKGQPKMDKKALAATPLKPALASIRDSCEYMGKVSRAKFYADVLPELDTIHIGARHFVVVASMDRLIAARLATTNAPPTAQKPRRRKSDNGSDLAERAPQATTTNAAPDDQKQFSQ
jgi:hypothetical protein